MIELKILDYKAVDRIGKNKRKLYCWNLAGEIYFQAGCKFDKHKNFLKAVNYKYPENSEYHVAIEFLLKLINQNKEEK